MKKTLTKFLFALDLWVLIVASAVFIALYYLESVIYYEEIIIVLTSFVSINMICFILLSLNYPKQPLTLKRKDTKNY